MVKLFGLGNLCYQVRVIFPVSRYNNFFTIFCFESLRYIITLEYVSVCSRWCLVSDDGTDFTSGALEEYFKECFLSIACITK